MRDKDSILLEQMYASMIGNKNILLESIGYLYHYTSPWNAERIINDGYFAMTFASATEAEVWVNGNRHFYLSCSRIPVGGYNDNMYPKNIHCIFQLDRRRISHNYKIIPVNYWAGMGKTENEDRIVSNKNKLGIDNVVALHVYVPPDFKVDDNRSHFQFEILKSLENQNDVMVHFYYDMGAFSNLDLRKSSHTLKDVEIEDFEKMEPYSSDNERSLNDLRNLIDWFENPTDPRFKKEYYDRWHFHDSAISIKSNLHNAKSMKHKKGYQDELFRLARLLRSRKTNLDKLIETSKEESRKAFR